MNDYIATRVLDSKAELGECPLWSADDQCLYWIDIMGSTINRFDPRTGRNTAWMLPSVPGCFAFRDGGGAVVAAQDGIYDMDFATGALERLIAPAHDFDLMRFNDGRTDRQGRLWMGTVHAADMVANPAVTAYFRYDGTGIHKGIEPVGMANGAAFSPDGRTMYRVQTTDRLIFAHDYDPVTGTPSRARVFAVVPDELGMPDGATVDSEGGYWVALPVGADNLGKGGIARYTPDGRLDVYFDAPVPMPTMVAFGGPDLSTLYITSGRLQDWVSYKVPDIAGSLFSVETPFRGIAETKFIGVRRPEGR
jgi:sugar lactone lactonase YvrE